MPASQARYRPETRLVHAGTLRSQFGETSEALFLTQGYVYESSAQAERRFKNEEPGYQYSRFANPTVAMFEARMAAFEGAEAARAALDRKAGSARERQFIEAVATYYHDPEHQPPAARLEPRRRSGHRPDAPGGNPPERRTWS